MGIRMNPPVFPEQRRQDPKRRAEAEVFDALQNLELGGHGLYEFRYRHGGVQVDYALWLDGLGRFAGSVKGGQHVLDRDGQWFRRTPNGALEPIPSPLKELVDGCMEMRNGIREATGFRTFIAGLLFLPDMQPDEVIERVAWNHEHMHVIYGLDSLNDDLERIVVREDFDHPPKPGFSENESRRANELQYRGPAGPREGDRVAQDAAPGPATGPESARQLTLDSAATINIHHVDTLVIQHGPQERDTDGRPDGTGS